MNERKHLIPIEFTAALVKEEGSIFYYIRHIFNALYEHKELLEDEEYLRLYHEARDYLYRRNVKEGYWQDLPVEEGYEWIEFLAQLSNSKPEFIEKFSLETVEAFLEERRKMWYM